MATTIGTVTGMPAPGATGVNPNTPLVVVAPVADSASGFAMLEVQISTENTFTTGLLADIESRDVVAPTATNASVVLQLNGATRDAGVQPFGQPGSTVWNTAVGTSATYSAGSGSDARVTDFASDTGGTISASYPIFFANATDAPTVVAVGGVPHSYQIPAAGAPSSDATHGLIVISPDHSVAYETKGTVVGGGITLISGNLLDLNTQDLETTIGTWFANVFGGDPGCTVARSSAQAYNGTWSLALTCAASPGATAQTGTISVSALTSYTALIRTLGPTSRNCTINFQWKDSGGAFISNSTGTATTQTGSWIQSSFTTTSPVGAATGSIYVSFYDSGAGEVYYLDLCYFGTSATPTFSGAGWTATSWAQVDLVGASALLAARSGSGWDGARGCGASILGGMLREVERGQGGFPHALAVGLSLAQLTNTALWPASVDPAASGSGTGTIAGNLLDADTEDLEATIGTWVVNANCTITRDVTHASFGTHALKVASTAAGAIAQTGSATVAALTSYTAIAQVWVPTGIHVLIGCQEKTSGGGFIQNNFNGNIVGNNAFQQLSMTITTQATTGLLSLFCDATDSISGTNWWIDSVYIGTNATPGSPTSGGPTGHNPMGEMLAIPQSVTLSGLGLNATTLPVATALQKYGAYVVGVESGFRLYAEPGINATFLTNLNSDMHLLTAQLRVVTNSSSVLSALNLAGAQGGGAALVSAPLPLAQVTALLAPAVTTNPVISGNPSIGSALVTTNGSWSGSPTSFTYVWRRNGVTIAGANNASYVLVLADTNTTITSVVTATNAVGSTSAASNAIGVGGTSTFTVQNLINSMTVTNAPHYPSGPDGYSWQMGPDFAQMDPGLPLATCWGWIWPDHNFGNPPADPAGVSIQLRHMILGVWSNSAARWLTLQASDTFNGQWDYGIGSGQPVGGQAQSPVFPTAVTDGSGGGYITPQSQRVYQFYPGPGLVSVNSSDIGAAYCEWQVRVIITPGWGGADNRSQAHYLALAGADWWQLPSTIQNIYNAGAIVIPNDGTWTTACGWTGPSNFNPTWAFATGAYPSSGWSITQLTNNPPILSSMGPPL